MGHGGARKGAGRKPRGVNANALATVDAYQKARAEAQDADYEDVKGTPLSFLLDAVEWYRSEAPLELKKILDPATPPEEKKMRLAIFTEFRSLKREGAAIARDAAQCIHRRLMGERPLDQDRPQGPKYLNLKAIEQAF